MATDAAQTVRAPHFAARVGAPLYVFADAVKQVDQPASAWGTHY